jgi:hypothetical protein
MLTKMAFNNDNYDTLSTTSDKLFYEINENNLNTKQMCDMKSELYQLKYKLAQIELENKKKDELIVKLTPPPPPPNPNDRVTELEVELDPFRSTHHYENDSEDKIRQSKTGEHCINFILTYPNLQKLKISDKSTNCITQLDLSPLSKLTNLQELIININVHNNISNLNDITTLKKLTINNNNNILQTNTVSKLLCLEELIIITTDINLNTIVPNYLNLINLNKLILNGYVYATKNNNSAHDPFFLYEQLSKLTKFINLKELYIFNAEGINLKCNKTPQVNDITLENIISHFLSKLPKLVKLQVNDFKFICNT